MPAYRVYCLDGAGKVWAAEWIEAEDDSAAIEAARQFKNAVRCEVWHGQRLVGRVDLKPNESQAGLRRLRPRGGRVGRLALRLFHHGKQPFAETLHLRHHAPFGREA